MRKNYTTKILFSVVLALCLAATATASLSTQINAIIARKTQKKTDFAIKVINAQTGNAVYVHNSHIAMIPASNMKIITSAAAMKYLGAEYEFTTKLAMIDDTLVIIGGGDPLLGDQATDKKYQRSRGWLFNDIIATLKEKKITRIKDIIIDSTFFDDNRVHPNWPKEQLNQWYACEVSGLNYNNNCVKINVRRAGKRVAITVLPKTKYVKIVNKVTPVSKGPSAAGAYRNSTPNKLIIKGKCNKSTGFDTAIERPAAFFGFLLAEKLAAAGIEVTGQLAEKYVRNDKRIKILKVYTTPLADVLARCNKDSLGLAAEALVKTISAENTTRKINGEWPHGLTLIGRYLQTLNIPKAEFNLDDGSGLSRKNMLSPNVLTTVIYELYKGKNWLQYKNSLAAGGVDGTIEKYFKEQKYKGKIFGKTGYINGIRSFSGLCQTANGDYIFSILTTGGNGNTRKAINDITKAIMDNPR